MTTPTATKCVHGVDLDKRRESCTTCFIDDCAILTPGHCSCDNRTSETEIVCPNCKEEFDTEARGPFVTYWGEDGWQDANCSNCNATLKVSERVSRTFEAVVVSVPSEAAL